MWPKRKHQKAKVEKNRKSPVQQAGGDVEGWIARQERLAAPGEYPDGKTPAAAVEKFLGSSVTGADAANYLGSLGMIGFNQVSRHDPDQPSALLQKYGRSVLVVVGMQTLNSDLPVDVAALLAKHEQEPTPTQTQFFRESSMLVLAENIAGPYQRKVGGRQLRIADVACSSGEETWSMAAALKGNDIDAHIDGFDISRRSVQVAQEGGPYSALVSSLKLDLGVGYGHDERERYVSYFQPGDSHYEVFPTQDLTEMASFSVLDISTESLEPKYDAVVAYNMLWHYPQQTREHMLGNMLDGLQPGGAFVFEGVKGGRDANISQDYRLWADDLSRFGLEPHPGIGVGNEWAAGSILLYNPSQRVTQAIPATTGE